MEKKDIILLIEILKGKERNDLALLLEGSKSEVKNSWCFGEFSHSIISKFIIYSPPDKLGKLDKLNESDKKVIFESILKIHLQGDDLPEFVNEDSVKFQLLIPQEDSFIETPELKTLELDSIRDYINKCKDRIERNEYSGAVTSANTLVETVCNMINSSDKPNIESVIKKLEIDKGRGQGDNNGFQKNPSIDIAKYISYLRNNGGDSHGEATTPQKRIVIDKSEAILAVNLSLSICEFLITRHQLNDIF